MLSELNKLFKLIWQKEKMLWLLIPKILILILMTFKKSRIYKFFW